MEKKNISLIMCIWFIMCIICLDSRAETIYTKDGKTINARIVNDTRNTIWYEAEAGKLSISKSMVSKILNDDGTVSRYSPSSEKPESLDAKISLQPQNIGISGEKNVYTSADSKIIIQYPSNWQCEETNGIPVFIPLVDGFPMAGMIFVMLGTPSMEILAIDYEFRNAEEALKALIDSYSRLEGTDFAAGFELLDKGTDTIDNKEAGFIIYNLTKQDLRKKDYVFFDNEKAYSIQYVSNSESFDKYISEADTIMKSIKIIEHDEKVAGGNETKKAPYGYWDQVYMPKDQLRNIARAAKGYYSVYSSYPDNLSILANAEPPWIDKGLLNGWKGYKFKIIEGGKEHFIATAILTQPEPAESRIFCVTEDGIVKEAHREDNLSYEYIKTLKAASE